jgi:hypothetical protein
MTATRGPICVSSTRLRELGGEALIADHDVREIEQLAHAAAQAPRVEHDGDALRAGALRRGDVGRRVAPVDQQEARAVQQLARQLARIQRRGAAPGVAHQPPPRPLVHQDE